MEFDEIAFKFLRSCQIKIDRFYLTRKIRTHPNYPALISLTDILDELKVTYCATKVANYDIENLQYPLLNYEIRNGKGEFSIHKSYSSFKKIPNISDINWSGIVLTLQFGDEIHNRHHKESVIDTRSYKIVGGLILLGTITIDLISLIIQSNFLITIFTAVNILGIFICAIIIMKGIGLNTSLTENFCKSTDEGCDKILNSKSMRIFGDIGFGDIGLVYFVALHIFTFLLCCSNLLSKGINYLFISCFLAFLFTIFSVWYQATVARSWCRLCLITTTILWLQFLNIGLNIHYFFPNTRILNFTLELNLLFIFSVTISLTWIYVKREINLRISFGEDQIRYIKWRRNPETFRIALSQEKMIKTTGLNEQITIGNINSKCKLLMVCNPYCKPCSEMHKKLDDLSDLLGEDACLIFVFLIPDLDRESKSKTAVNAILNSFFNEAIINKKKIISDWFDSMDLNQWMNIYSAETNNDYTFLLASHNALCANYNIQKTPTLFVNNFELPQNYEIEDLTHLYKNLG